jgi:soluble P-type ATPase
LCNAAAINDFHNVTDIKTNEEKVQNDLTLDKLIKELKKMKDFTESIIVYLNSGDRKKFLKEFS